MYAKLKAEYESLTEEEQLEWRQSAFGTVSHLKGTVDMDGEQFYTSLDRLLAIVEL